MTADGEKQASAVGGDGGTTSPTVEPPGPPGPPAPTPEPGPDPLLDPSARRYCLFPVRYDEMYRGFYKRAVASYWTVEEVDLGRDLQHWRALTDDERRFIECVLAFFASSDGIVMHNLSVNFGSEVVVPEAQAFYAFQAASEAVHSEMYSLLIHTYVPDKARQDLLFDAVRTMPAVARKAGWAQRWMSRDAPFGQRLVAFAAVEGIHFSASFCAVFWLKKRGLMPGLSFSNELISRDEGLHRDFACHLFSLLRDKPDPGVVLQIVREAVAIEEEFVTESLPVSLIGMNAGEMARYVRFVADGLLVALGQEPEYGCANPFDWMELISLQGKANFFERRVGEYQRAEVMQGAWAADRFSLDEDF